MFVCKTRRRHALTLTLTCRLSRSLSLTTDLKPCSKPNRNQVGSRLQKAKDEAQVPKAEEEEDSLYAGVGDFEFDVSPPARPGPGRSLPRPEHAAAHCVPTPLQAVTVTALLGAAIAFQFFVLANL